MSVTAAPHTSSVPHSRDLSFIGQTAFIHSASCSTRRFAGQPVMQRQACNFPTDATHTTFAQISRRLYSVGLSFCMNSLYMTESVTQTLTGLMSPFHDSSLLLSYNNLSKPLSLYYLHFTKKEKKKKARQSLGKYWSLYTKIIFIYIHIFSNTLICAFFPP